MELVIDIWYALQEYKTFAGAIIVETKFGPVQGGIRYSIGSDRPVQSFFGIPYARCPDYMFRFRAPNDPWTWTDILDVSDESKPPICHQVSIYVILELKHAIMNFALSLKA